MKITDQEAWTDRDTDIELNMPTFFKELIEEVAVSARNSEFVDQKSGVSARMSISLLENVCSNMERRALIHGEKVCYPRISDLHAALTAITGKVELVYEGEKEGPAMVARKLIGDAVKQVFQKHFPKTDEAAPYKKILDWFAGGNNVTISPELSSREYSARLKEVPELKRLSGIYLEDELAESDGLGMELLLEGLHQHSMVSKRELGEEISYQDMLKSMFGNIGAGE
jgi:magnesium chelatase subunit I